MALVTLCTAYAAHVHSYYPRDTLASTQFSDDSQFTDRSIWNIVWSCFATIFACTWISVHQNIPAPNDSAIRIFGRRLAIMFNLLIAPEMVIVWTTRQSLAASAIVKRHKAKGWTKTHAFFLIMGGFSLYQDGVLLRTLEAHEMEKLEEEGKIEWPAITEAEIKDKSKGDFFSKGVVVMQTTWFIIQCIVRGSKRMVLTELEVVTLAFAALTMIIYGLWGSKRMVLTELEVVTLAFAALTMIIYGLWWHKPLDVQVSVPIHLKKGCSADPDPKPEKEKRKATSPSVVLVGEDDDNLQTSLLEAVEGPETSADVDAVTHPQTSLLQSKTSVALDVDVEAQDTSERSQSVSPEPMLDPPVTRPYHDPSLSLPQQFRLYLRAKREELGLIGSIVYVFTIRPGVMFFGAFYDMMFCTTLEEKRYRVPTFYAPAVEDDSMSIVLAILVAIVFGGLHCIAWSFEFPTLIEKWAWRVSAVLVSGLPLSISFLSVLTASMGNKNADGNGDAKEYSSALVNVMDNALIVILSLSTFLYIAARGILLILPLVGLRALPAGAYIDLNWTAYLPHV
ncbi:hypothetical protein CVT25_010635 [Psilocybe cyanescens]|uniref:Uncharacterized protein n=1 Tax=Psilocybe cyanescens TaxID=93625 RepID=A0A409XWL5_PSICY|nr:hypothetical protein CVT25_010635 [Psilocybe cyanescens]